MLLKHLQFADDTIIFVPKNDAIFTNYFRLLDVFALMSGLKLNYYKSSIITWCNNDIEWATDIANQIGCVHQACPVSYLGLPLGANTNKISTWKPVISKIEHKLSSWKAKLLSRAGRLTLIKSVLNSLPVYFMSMFKMPKAVAQRIVKLQRKFFWGESNHGAMQPPAVRWSSVELPKEVGGLGVGNILYKNLILLFKWWWRFSGCDNALWKRILISIHNIKGLKATSDSFAHIKHGTWAQLMSMDEDTRKIRDIVQEGTRIDVGDGSSTRFWHDPWCPSSPLKCSFPRLFSISIQSEALISQMGEWVNEVWSWKFRWRRHLFDWEKEEFDNLMLIIEHRKLVRNKKDGVTWHGVETKKFPVKAIVDKIYESSDPILPPSVSRYIWSIKIPPRSHIVLWLACLKKLKTGDILMEKGGLDPTLALCPFGCDVIESNSHILFTCTFSWKVWMHVLNWWGISGALHMNCVDFMIAWRGMVTKRRGGKLWNLILGCVIWSLWFERNKVKFDRGVPNVNNMCYNLRIRVGIWAREMLGLDLLSYNTTSLRAV